MSRDGLQPNPEEQGLERPVACPTAKWASSPALCPNGREFDPSEPSNQHQTRPEVELSLRRCRLRGRKQSSIDVDVDINVYVIGLPVRFLSWDLFGTWDVRYCRGLPLPPGHAGCSSKAAADAVEMMRHAAQRSAAQQRSAPTWESTWEVTRPQQARTQFSARTLPCVFPCPALTCTAFWPLALGPQQHNPEGFDLVRHDSLVSCARVRRTASPRRGFLHSYRICAAVLAPDRARRSVASHRRATTRQSRQGNQPLSRR